MSSRVQKGGTIFKPLARQKSRPATAGQSAISRQPSVVTDQEYNPSSSPSSGASTLRNNNRTASLHSVDDVSIQTSIGTSSISNPVNISVDVPTPHPPSDLSSSRAPPVILSQSTAPPIPASLPSHPIPSPSGTPMRSDAPLSGLNVQPVESSRPPSENAPAPRLALNAKDIVKRRGNPTTRVQPRVQDPGVDAKRDDNSESVSSNHDKGALNEAGKVKKRRISLIADAEDVEVAASPTKRRKRLPKSKQIVDDESDNDEPVKKTRRGGARKALSPSLPHFDSNVNPGEDLDPTAVTMASLCSDTGQGRVSSKAQEIQDNHAAWKASNREQRARMKARMERKKYGRPEEENELEAPATAPSLPSTDPTAESSAPGQPSTSSRTQLSTSAATDLNADPDSFDYSQNLTASRFNVQVRIGPNGETVIDEESLFVDQAENAEDDTRGYTHVIETDRSKFTNSSTYGTKLRGSRWSAAETELFYEALAQYGENYELISYVLPGRDRKSCKNKFKAEDKKNPARINHCLNNSIPVDIGTLSRMTGRNFSGPVPEFTSSHTTAPAVSTFTAVAEGPFGGARQAKQHDISPLSKPHKRSCSHTAGVGEEGLMVIGDLNTFVDED
ncbi:hypothetical protein GYMLUDRAFT_51955 [Collybiopsis luxurians FD-317 M1]|nr:hypothetical protein GYMLUDRAFT_51955 [Collybiopsis luxurians FD-317 M1]